MIVQCPECTTKYNLDESKIGHEGSKVRCSRCKNVFTVFKPMQPEVPAPAAEAPRPAPSLGDFDDDLFAPTAGPAPVPAEPARPAPRPALDDLEEDLSALMGGPGPAAAAPSQGSSKGGDFEDDLAMLLGDAKPAAGTGAPASRQTSAAEDFEDDLDAMLGGGSAPAEPARSSSRPVLDDLEDDLAAMMGSAKPAAEPPAAKPAAKPSSSVDEDMIADLQGAFQQPLLGSAGKDPLRDEEPAPKPKKSGKLGLILGLLLLLLAAGGAGVYFLQPALLGLGSHGGEEKTPTAGAPREGAAQIALENVRQYFVPNEKEGQLFIIEGKAVNRFPGPRELIRLKASLFDKQGGEVTSQEFMCGNVVSLYQLQVSSRADIEAALTAKVGILTNNTNIQPGASVPFMAVFFKTPETVEEFGLEVIQSTAPQQ